MLATQKGRSKPVRISWMRSETVKGAFGASGVDMLGASPGKDRFSAVYRSGLTGGFVHIRDSLHVGPGRWIPNAMFTAVKFATKSIGAIVYLSVIPVFPKNRRTEDRHVRIA